MASAYVLLNATTVVLSMYMRMHWLIVLPHLLLLVSKVHQVLCVDALFLTMRQFGEVQRFGEIVDAPVVFVCMLLNRHVLLVVHDMMMMMIVMMIMIFNTLHLL